MFTLPTALQIFTFFKAIECIYSESEKANNSPVKSDVFHFSFKAVCFHSMFLSWSLGLLH